MIKTEINAKVKIKMVICKMRTQRSSHKKMICYCKNLDKLMWKWNKIEGLKFKGKILNQKRIRPNMAL